ncbi:MAG: T9SS type A sorting domain-containing protein [Ignavibacteriaceae bacterium]|nr:T9SS type A sorting domain-containing protein [Ignavibacteriaceae bacterium]
MKKLFTTTAVSIVFIFLFAGWGSTGHKIINSHVTVCFPSSMNFPAYWSDTLAAHASDADNRKGKDPTESPRHFIDIDIYPEFVANDSINRDYNAFVALHGSSAVITNGVLPWAIIQWKDSLTDAFRQLNWHSAMMLAADIGHYVGDGHQPLHCTENYDGAMTNQSGVHSRYETTLVGQYQTSIVYAPSTATYVSDVSSYVFNFIYLTNKYVDSTLYGDSVAHAFAGSTSGTVYLQKYWDLCGNQIIQMMKTASRSVADLIYTAWIDAGSPAAQTPVELTAFTAASNDRNVTLSWSTATEINNKGFEVEKSVNNSWQSIGFIEGQGSTTERHSYSFVDKNLSAGTYSYRLKQIDFSGKITYSEIVKSDVLNPAGYVLSQNYPNPFNPSTTIHFNLAERGNVSLKVYDIIGNEVAELVNSEKEAGNYDVNFDASKLSSGVYFYELRSAGFTQSKKMMLMK